MNTGARPDAPQIRSIDLLNALSGAVASGREVCIPVSGKSMGSPFAAARGIVVVPYDPAAVGVGSVIVFQRDDHWTVHRVMAVYMRNRQPCYIAKGDGLACLDRPIVEAASVKGIVVGLDLNDGTRLNLASPGARWRARAQVLRGWITVIATVLRAAVRHPA